MKRIYVLLSMLLLSCGNPPECPKKHLPGKTTLSINIVEDPQTLDPGKVRVLNDVNLCSQLFEGLYRIDLQEKPSLALAESVEISEDGTVYTFKIRNALWSSGDPITSFDFLNSYKRTLTPSFPSPYAHELFVIKNAKLIKEGKLPFSLIGVECPDESTLIIELQKPISYFPELACSPIFFPIHESMVGKEGFVESIISSGPFILDSWNHQNTLVLKKNPLYWDAEHVHLSQIECIMVNNQTELDLFESGKLDWIGSPLSQIPTVAIPTLEKTHSLLKKPLYSTFWIRTNTSHLFLRNTNARKALSLAIDRNGISQHALSGSVQPSSHIIPNSSFPGESSESPRILFEKAIQETEIGSTIDLSLIYVASERNSLIAQALQAQWKEELGITLHLNPMEGKLFLDALKTRQFDLALGSWIGDYQDPTTFLHVFQSKETPTNNTGWEDPFYTELLEKISYEVNEEKREHFITQAASILENALPAIPLFSLQQISMKSPNLHGVVVDGLGHINLKHAYFEGDL